MNRRRLAIDVLASLLVAGVAFTAGRASYLNGARQHFYQSEFGPAVMVALGHGFVNPTMIRGSALEAFLTERTVTLEVGAVGAVSTVPTDQLQNSHRYLLITVGLWWRLAGISWQRISEVAGLLHAMSAVATYATVRLFTPSAPAALAGLWFASSPQVLSYIPLFRDFCKAPFVLGAIPLLLAAVLRLASTRGLAITAAALGALIGVGIGFRMDAALMAPVAVAGIVLFRGERPWSAIAQKAAAVATLVAALTVTAWPVVSRLSAGGSNAFHVVLLGYSDWFDSRLGVEPASYGFLPFYSDPYAVNVVRVRSMQTAGVDAPMPSKAYDDTGRDLWLRWLRHFPADAHTRLLAAMDGVLNLAFRNAAGTPGPFWPAGDRLSGWFAWLDGFNGRGWLVGILLVLAAARRAPRLAILAAALLMALTGYPSLQFEGRHYFHLQAIPIAALVVLGWTSLSWLAALARRRSLDRADWSWSAWLRPLSVTMIIAVAITLAPAVTLRAYQKDHLREAFSDLLHRDRSPVAVEFDALDSHRYLARWEGSSGDPSGVPNLSFAYFVAEFAADEPRSIMAVGLRYASAPGSTACAMVRTLVTSAGIARFAFPVYTVTGESRFEGLEMGAAMKRRLSGIYRVRTPPPDLPIELRLAADWQARRLFQRVIGEERYAADNAGAWVTPIDHCGARLVPVDATIGPDLAVDADAATFVSPQAAIRDSAITFDGDVDAFAPLVQLAPRQLRAGDVLVTRLWLEHGSVTVGLLKDGVSHRFEIATRPGASVIAVRVDEGGTYAPLISAPDPGWRSGVRFTIDRLGIVSAAAGDPASQ